jgi:biotin synthase-related radical SAM superfamily protein
MTYTQSRCSANCAFCAQARESSAKANQLSRITWPDYSLELVLDALTENRKTASFKRFCIQTLCYPKLEQDLTYLVSLFKRQLPQVPISIALPPLSAKQLNALNALGVDRVAISLDAITPPIFERIKGKGVKGPFTWNQHYHALESAQAIFGPGRVTTHLIIGLGETEYQTIQLIWDLTAKGVRIGLFPLTPLTGTPLAQHDRPALDKYRRIQLALFLIQNALATPIQMRFDSSKQLISFGMRKETLEDVIARGKAFQTTGCPSCNRPFFTENPGGPLYNYPYPPSNASLHQIRNQLGGIL